MNWNDRGCSWLSRSKALPWAISISRNTRSGSVSRITCKAVSTPLAVPTMATCGQKDSSNFCSTRMLSISSSTNTVRIIGVFFCGFYKQWEFHDNTRPRGPAVTILEVDDFYADAFSIKGIYQPDAICCQRHSFRLIFDVFYGLVTGGLLPADSVVLDHHDKMVFGNTHSYPDPAPGIDLMAEAMPHAVLHIGLDHHRRDHHGLLVDLGGNLDGIIHLLLEPHLLERKIGKKIAHLIGQRDKALAGIVQGGPDQFGKPGDVFVGGKDILIEDVLLNRIQTIENEMRIHLRLQRHMFRLAHLPRQCFLFLLSFADMPDPQGYQKPGRRDQEKGSDCREPCSSPKRRGHFER